MRVIYVYMNNGSVFKFYDKMNNVENYIEKENKNVLEDTSIILS